MSAERYVIDTNVLISAALSPSGNSRRALDDVIAAGQLLLSDATFSELASRLMHAKVDRWVTREARLNFLEQLTEFADWVEIEGIAMGCRDPSDDIFLETALRGNAEGIITGGADLLAMHPFEDIPIIAPGDWIS